MGDAMSTLGFPPVFFLSSRSGSGRMGLSATWPGIVYFAALYLCFSVFVYSGHLVFLREVPGAGGELADVPGHLQGHEGRRRGA